MVPFVYLQTCSAYGKIQPGPSSLTSARWMWVETSSVPAIPRLFRQGPARKNNIWSPFWAQPGVYLRFVTDTGQLLAHREPRRQRLCLSSKIIIFASVTVTDISGLHSQLNYTEKRPFSFSLVAHVLRKPENMDNSSCKYLGAPGGVLRTL